MHPPSYATPLHATAILSLPFENVSEIGGSGTPSTATDADARSVLCSFMISTLYFPLWSDVMLLMINLE
jgi:hypothetical protein